MNKQTSEDVLSKGHQKLSLSSRSSTIASTTGHEASHPVATSSKKISTAKKADKSEVKQVRETGDWSSDSKLSAIHNGYWEDPFFRFFNPNDPSKVRRTSLICRGYYIRYRVCDYFLRGLIKAVDEPVQVVSLGCGMDSCYFRILPELEIRIWKYFEVDFRSVIKVKKSVIAHKGVLRLMAEEKLKLLSCDLRYIVTLHQALKLGGFDFNKPTVFYSECVVNYLGPNETKSILDWITANVPNSIWLAYEQCNALDSFGQIMLSHFLKNGCPLLSLISAHSREDQEAQLRTAGFKISQVINAWDAFVQIGNDNPPHFPKLKSTDHQFDEYEQLIATSLHYSVRVGVNGLLSSRGAITDFLEIFHLQSVPPALLPDVFHESVKDSMTLKLKIMTCTGLPTLTGHAAVVIKPNTLLTLGGSVESSLRMKHLIKSKIIFQDSDPNLYLSKIFEEDSIASNSSFTPENRDGLSVESKILLENAEHYERLHSCAVFIPSRVKDSESYDSVLIFGGRKSPKTPCTNDLIELNVNKIGSKVNIASVIVSSKFDGTCPQPRWRHAMALHSKSGVPLVLLFGGRSTDIVLGDCWLYNVNDFSWNEIYKSGGSVAWPNSRHSHSMTSDIDGKLVYMSGGICDNDTTLCEDAFWIYDASSEKWTNIDDWNLLARRVGHSMLKHKDLLFIVGGYGADSSYGFDFLAAVFDLENNTVKIITQTLPLSDSYLPFGFTASLLHDESTDKSKLVIFGGGGNCFSFGTHYNQVTYVLSMME